MTTGSQQFHAPRFEPIGAQQGVRIMDPVEDVQFDLYTPEPVTPQTCDLSQGAWCFPIDSAVRLDVDRVTVPLRVNVNVRRPDGTLVASAANQVPTTVDERVAHTVELGSTPVKLFLSAESRIRVTPREHRTEVAFPDADAIYLGARTLHEQPARTLTTTSDPEDLMRVVSEFGAALKTTSCERSFPTLRGHPPLVELGDRVEIPGGGGRPDTGITIEVPPEHRYVYPVAPLAYYLGAAVRPGSRPRLVTDQGFEYRLDGPEGFERRTTRVLRQVFTMDCLTRVEGYYPVDLAERNTAERSLGLDLDYASLYDAPLAEQVETYLSLPYRDVAEVAPEWRLTADLPVDPGYAGVLPFLANELATVRCDGRDPTTDHPAASDTDLTTAIDSFVRGRDRTRNDETWATDHSLDQQVETDDVFRIEDADTATQTYIGEGFPLGANKGSKESYERQLSLRAETPTHIGVTVVCNDEEMMEEVGVGDHYGTRDLFEFDVDIETRLTRAELREVFESEADFVHYIGHVDQRGMQATDGYLDANTLDDVGVTAFFLNGCRSFRQGSALVEAGAIAGIVTLENVHNGLATAVGNNVARLLNAGWPLDGALELVEEDALVGRNYIVVGDGSVGIANAESIPNYAVVESRADGDYELTVHAYPTRSQHLGTLYTPYVSDNQTRYVASGELDTFVVGAEELRAFFELETIPVLRSGDRDGTTISLQWSDEINVGAL